MLETMFKDNLKFLLAKTGKSKSDIARALDVSPQSAQDYLKGTIPKTDKMIVLAEYLGVDAGVLHYGTIDEGVYLPGQSGVWLPVLNLNEVTGYLSGEFKPDSNWYCTYEVSDEAFVVIQEGDSMNSGDDSISIPDGSMVIVEPTSKIDSNKVVLARIMSSGAYTIKRYVSDLGNDFLVSNNSMYPPISGLEDIELVGVAKYALSKADLL